MGYCKIQKGDIVGDKIGETHPHKAAVWVKSPLCQAQESCGLTFLNSWEGLLSQKNEQTFHIY